MSFKPRNKGQAIDAKQINNIVNNCYQRLSFVGDCFTQPRAMGIQYLYTHLRGQLHDAGMKHFFKHIEREMPWTLYTVCYFRDSVTNDVKAITVAAVCTEIGLIELSNNLSDILLESINRSLYLDDRYNEENMFYYTYVLFPEFNVEYEIKADGLGALMINQPEIETLEPFGPTLPGIEMEADVLIKAVINNGNYPKTIDNGYDSKDTEIFYTDNAFLLQQDPVNETVR